MSWKRTAALALMVSLTLACGPLKRAGRRASGDAGEADGGGARTGGGAGPIASLELIEIESSGKDRTAFLHVPKGLSRGKHPLVFGFHGGSREDTEKGKLMAKNWSSEFDGKVVFVFPNAAYDGGAKHVWYGPRDGNDSRVDLDFMRDLIDEIDRRVGVDRDQVYVSGFSAGGVHAWHVQCADPEPYAGFAMMSSQMPDMVKDGCNPSVKRPVWYMHGADDRRISPEGGPDGGSMEECWDWLISTRDCKPQPKERPKISSAISTGKGQVFACDAPTCPEIEVWSVEGMAHCWPKQRDADCGRFEANELIFDYWHRTAGLPR